MDEKYRPSANISEAKKLASQNNSPSRFDKMKLEGIKCVNKLHVNVLGYGEIPTITKSAICYPPYGVWLWLTLATRTVRQSAMLPSTYVLPSPTQCSFRHFIATTKTIWCCCEWFSFTQFSPCMNAHTHTHTHSDAIVVAHTFTRVPCAEIPPFHWIFSRSVRFMPILLVFCCSAMGYSITSTHSYGFFSRAFT